MQTFGQLASYIYKRWERVREEEERERDCVSVFVCVCTGVYTHMYSFNLKSNIMLYGIQST